MGEAPHTASGLEALCPKIIERWEAEPWKGFQIPHRHFALSVKQSVQCMVVFIPLTTSPPSKSLQVCPGTQGGYHAAHRWDIVIQPLRSVTLLRGTVIHRGAGGPGRALFIPFAPVGYRSRMLTVEPESVTELMNSVPVMPSELLAEGAAVGSPLCLPYGSDPSRYRPQDPPPRQNYSPLDQGSEEAEAAPADPVPASTRWTCRRRRRMRRRGRPRRLTRMPPPPHRVRHRRRRRCRRRQWMRRRRRMRRRQRMRRRWRMRRRRRKRRRGRPPPPPGRGGLPHSRRDHPASLLRVAGCAAVGPPGALHGGRPPPARGGVCGSVSNPHRPRARGAHRRGGQSGCLPHSAHPPLVASPPRGHRLLPRALHGRHGGVLVRRTGRCVRAGARGRPHGLDGHGPLHPAPELPGCRDVGPRPRGQGPPHHLLLQREGVHARCLACMRCCHT